nr:adult cement protein 26 [Chelonibia testudinaria]
MKLSVSLLLLPISLLLVAVWVQPAAAGGGFSIDYQFYFVKLRIPDRPLYVKIWDGSRVSMLQIPASEYRWLGRRAITPVLQYVGNEHFVGVTRGRPWYMTGTAEAKLYLKDIRDSLIPPSYLVPYSATVFIIWDMSAVKQTLETLEPSITLPTQPPTFPTVEPSIATVPPTHPSRGLFPRPSTEPPYSPITHPTPPPTTSPTFPPTYPSTEPPIFPPASSPTSPPAYPPTPPTPHPTSPPTYRPIPPTPHPTPPPTYPPTHPTPHPTPPTSPPTPPPTPPPTSPPTEPPTSPPTSPPASVPPTAAPTTAAPALNHPSLFETLSRRDLNIDSLIAAIHRDRGATRTQTAGESSSSSRETTETSSTNTNRTVIRSST